MEFVIGLLSSSMRIMTSYLFGALGAVYAARAGVVNMAVEGEMLVGAFCGFLTAYFTGSAWLGVLAGMGAGMLMGAILAVVGITLKANQVVTGTIITMLAVGLTGFLYTIIFGKVAIVSIEALPIVPVPFLSKIPTLGPILFNNSILSYLALILAFCTWWLLFKTPAGLTIRAVGKNPEMAASLGIRVTRVKYACTLVSGAICGVGGAFLSLDMLSTFIQNMVAGKGYLAIAANVLGQRHPIGVILSSLVFGLADASQIRLQTYGIRNLPTEFIQMIPYLAAILALYVSTLRGRVKPPRRGKKEGAR